MVENKRWRTIIFYKNYFSDFFVQQRLKVKERITWTFDLIEEHERVPEKYLKHLKDEKGLYEIKVQVGNNEIRIFCFFDKESLIILANGFYKKTQKTPKHEIEKALKIKKEYEGKKK
jgi:phage-related protein